MDSEGLVRKELIGLEVEVVESSNKDNIGLSGIIVDETKKTLVIRTAEDDLRIPKSNCNFVFSRGDNEEVHIQGSEIVGRPYERLK